MTREYEEHCRRWDARVRAIGLRTIAEVRALGPLDPALLHQDVYATNDEGRVFVPRTRTKGGTWAIRPIWALRSWAWYERKIRAAASERAMATPP